jgi:hypothetical protein
MLKLLQEHEPSVRIQQKKQREFEIQQFVRASFVFEFFESLMVSIGYSVSVSGNWKDGGEAKSCRRLAAVFLEVAYRGLHGGISGVPHVQRQQEPISAKEGSWNTLS